MKDLKVMLKKPAFYRRIAMVLMVILIVVRPRLSTEEADRELNNLNVWIVADATGSMVAKDVDNGNTRRFEKAQTDLTEIISKIPGAKYAVIAQDYSSYTASPMSSNADASISARAYLKPKYSLYAHPTNLTELLEYASTVIAKYQERYPERSNVMVFMSDGEDVSKNTVSVPSALARVLDSGVVLGYGSTKGSILEYVGGVIDGVYDSSAIMPDKYITHYDRNDGIEFDSEYRVISKINENNLKKIASGLGVDYYHRENGVVPARIINDFSRVAMSKVTESTDESTSIGAETYWIFAIILLFLLLWESEDTLARLLSEREAKHA